MNDQEINTLIAEACGWTEIPWEDLTNPREARENKQFCRSNRERLCGWMPHYTTDLNAMHEAEKVLPYYPDYLFHLREIVGPFPEAMSEWGDHDWADVVRSTARQRAEAFLKTIGKWKEGE